MKLSISPSRHCIREKLTLVMDSLENNNIEKKLELLQIKINLDVNEAHSAPSLVTYNVTLAKKQIIITHN